MKKSIGLTANISEYRPSLPQTRHLNYFMGTNPVHMANGGDVRAGIPNYPDVNVTRGFLPAALGFDDGGEVDKVGLLDILKGLDDVLIDDLALIIKFLQRNGILSEDATKEEIEKVGKEIESENGEKSSE